MDDREDVQVLFLDFSAAFDKVPHSVILEKMQQLKVPTWITKFCQSFLNNRRQYIELNDGSKSPTVLVKSGVPQGSIIGPILFCIATSDFPVVPNCSVAKYADDTTVWTTLNSKSPNLLQRYCQDISVWCRINSMQLNATKSATMIISLKRGINCDPLLLDGQPVPCVNNFKLLGLQFQNNLSWSLNTEVIVGKASRAMFLLKRFKSFGASVAVMKKLYFCFFLPAVEYASPVWDGNLTQKDATDLESLNKHALKICCIDSGETLSDRRKMASLKLFKIALNQPSHLLHSKIPKAISHGRNTRRAAAGALAVPRTRTELFKRSFINQTSRYYNELL